MKFVRTFGLALLFCSMAAMLGAQGVQTGTVRGVVQDEQGLAVPGVTVTVTSPSLQGPRVVTSDAQGGFIFPNLPPGPYQVKFELSGFATVNQNTNVPLGGIIQQNVTMRTAGLTETVQVVAESPAPIATPVVGINIKHEEIEQLATAAHAAGDRDVVAGAQRAVAQRRPAGDQRRVRVRQHLHGQRRRRERQPVRQPAEPLHRGRDRGDAGADLRHLGRVRPVRRRRRQRDHEKRRQQVLWERPRELPQPVLVDRDAVRGAEQRQRGRTSTSRRTKARSAVRSPRTTCGSSRPAATRRSRTRRRFR